ncbi:MAG: hypothetical protein U0821_25940 [Chloroflexota bacterium]
MRQLSSYVPPADLSISLTGPASPLAVGSVGWAGVTVTNLGPGTATNVIFNYTLPDDSAADGAGLVFQAANLPNGCALTSGVRRLTCNLGLMHANAPVSISIPIQTLSRGGFVHSVALRAGPDQTDPVGANNAASGLLAVTPPSGCGPASPAASVIAQVVGTNELRVIVTAGSGSIGQLVFTPDPLHVPNPNALVSLPGRPPTQMPPARFSPDSRLYSFSFDLHHQVGGATTLPFLIRDDCRDTQKFVGGGAASF